MEIEFFVPPAEAGQWYEYWCQTRLQWYLDLGIPADKLRLRAHESDELSHYSADTSDVEFLFPWGWDELEGIANRGDYDLTQHAEHSGDKLTISTRPAVSATSRTSIEPAAGVTRTMMAFLMAAYDEEAVNDDTRVVLRLHPPWRPTRWPSCPCRRSPSCRGPPPSCSSGSPIAGCVDYDETQNIGKRYRRQDEIGTPFCVTFDFDSLDDQAVTVRDATRWNRCGCRSTSSRDGWPSDSAEPNVASC